MDIQQKELDEEERWAEKMREDIEEVRFRMGRKLYERSMQDSMEQDLQAERENIHADLNQAYSFVNRCFCHPEVMQAIMACFQRQSQRTELQGSTCDPKK